MDNRLAVTGTERRVFGLLKKRAKAKGRIGLAFSGDQIAVAVLSNDGGAPVLERCELLPVDAAGGAEAMTAAMRAAVLPRLPVSVVLRPEDYQLALVEAPDVPPAELRAAMRWRLKEAIDFRVERSEEHTSELQSLAYLVCRLLLEKKTNDNYSVDTIMS